MHPAKRRKLQQPGGFLNKPFRSPLRSTNPQPQPPAEQTHIQAPATGVPSSAQQISPDITPGIRSSPQSTSNPRFSSQLAPADSGSRELQRQHTALSIRLTQLRQSLHTAEEALQIEGSKQNAELQPLISRWRAIAQDAAEELFADAKERIDQMGGIAQWRRQLEEDSRLWKINDEREGFTNKCEGDGEDDHRHNDGRETDPAEPVDYESDARPEENSFTMEVMLNQMNIDLQSIGFDKHQERWV